MRPSWLSKHDIDGVGVTVDALTGSGTAAILDGLSAIDLLFAHQEPTTREVVVGNSALLVIGLLGASDSATDIELGVSACGRGLRVGSCDRASILALRDAPSLRLERHAKDEGGDNEDNLMRRPPSTALSTFSEASALAAKTYVPATEASRVLGAGASASDND